ncbi:MAG: holo-ACP synthase [Kofleriaceae bacterium]
MTIGIDLVSITRIAESVATFGDKFLARVFTAGELAYARDKPDSLAARFAAKEAVKKALALDGVGWNEIEVVRRPSGACELHLHGAARAAADAIGATDLALSLSHEDNFATAVVVARCDRAEKA